MAARIGGVGQGVGPGDGARVGASGAHEGVLLLLRRSVIAHDGRCHPRDGVGDGIGGTALVAAALPPEVWDQREQQRLHPLSVAQCRPGRRQAGLPGDADQVRLQRGLRHERAVGTRD